MVPCLKLHIGQDPQTEIDLGLDGIELRIECLFSNGEVGDENWNNSRLAPHQQNQRRVSRTNLDLALLGQRDQLLRLVSGGIEQHLQRGQHWMQSVLHRDLVLCRFGQLVCRIEFDGQVDRLYRRSEHAQHVFAGCSNIAGIARRGALRKGSAHLLRVVLKDDGLRRTLCRLRLIDNQAALQ